MQLSNEVKVARAVALAQAIAGGTLCLRTGGMPSDPSKGSTGQEIASLPLDDKITVKGLTIIAVASPLRALAVAKGTAGYWRIEKAGKCVAQDVVGGSFPAIGEVEQGQMIEIGSWVINDGEK